MATDATLDGIALGDVDPAQALAALSKAFGGSEPNAVHRAYAALRAWVWKALDGRRRDPELREWFDVLRRVAAFLRPKHPLLAERVAVLHELVHESIAVSERLPTEETLQRRHVREVLSMLDMAPGNRLDRSEIGRRLGLKQGNLSRVLNMVTEAGLAERVVHGKQAEFRLTRMGEEAVERHGLRKAASGRTVSHTHRPQYGDIFRIDETKLMEAVIAGVERQGVTLTGYAKRLSLAREVQEAAAKNLYGKVSAIEMARVVTTARGHLGNLPITGEPSGKARNLWADSFHD